MKIAVAVALTFAMPVISYAHRHENKEIDGVKRYLSYIKWAGLTGEHDSVLFPVFQDLSAWHMRYVVGSWAEDTELEWARAHVPEDCRQPETIGQATHKMVAYRSENDKGVSIHNGSEFYNFQPENLDLLYQMGGVCGTVSKFGVACCQAFGVPALPLGQPGHCAYARCPDLLQGFVLDNDISGWDGSKHHQGIQTEWEGGPGSAHFLKLMHSAQVGRQYALSEKIRLVAGFIKSENSTKRLEVLWKLGMVACPENYSLWQEIVEEFNIYTKQNITDNIAEGCQVEVSDAKDRASNITENSESEWWTGSDAAWLEITLREPVAAVDHMKIHWWGSSETEEVRVYATAESGERVLVRTEQEELDRRDGINRWMLLPGWIHTTRKIRIEMSKGQSDPWGLGKRIGLRQVQVFAVQRGGLLPGDDLRWQQFGGIVEQLIHDHMEENLKQKNVALGKRTSVSSESNLAKNITDGTDSEWWTCEESAWVEIDLERLYRVEQVRIHWWGCSKASRFQILACGKGEMEVKCTEADITAETPDKLNIWTSIGGWSTPTSEIRINLCDGRLDIWGKRRMFGIRQIHILGLEYTGTVDLIENPWSSIVSSWGKVPEKQLLEMVENELRHKGLFKHQGMNTVWKNSGFESFRSFCDLFRYPTIKDISTNRTSHEPIITEIEVVFGKACYVKSVRIEWLTENTTDVLVQLCMGNYNYGKPSTDLNVINKVCTGLKLILNLSKDHHLLVRREIRMDMVKVFGIEHHGSELIAEKVKLSLFPDHTYVANKLISKLNKNI